MKTITPVGLATIKIMDIEQDTHFKLKNSIYADYHATITLICYAVDKRASFDLLGEMIKPLQRSFSPFILVGLRKDVRDQYLAKIKQGAPLPMGLVSSAEGEERAKQASAQGFFEISAKESPGSVVDVFSDGIQVAINEAIDKNPFSILARLLAKKRYEGGVSTGGGMRELWATLHSAANIMVADNNGFSDPYAEIQTIPQNRFKSKHGKTRTHTCKKTLNPVWDELLVIKLQAEDFYGTRGLAVTVMDSDTFTADECLGQAELSWSTLMNIRKEEHGGERMTLLLQKPCSKELQARIPTGGVVTGSVCVSIKLFTAEEAAVHRGEESKKKHESKKHKPRTFGEPLTELMERQQDSHPDLEIPYFLSEALKFLYSRKAENLEGIFRKSPEYRTLDILHDRFDKNPSDISFMINKNEEPSCLTVAAMIKYFLRELPDPILTFELYDQWAKVDTESTAEIRALYEQIPVYNKAVLKHVFMFLEKVIADEEHTLMNFQAMSIVIGPNLIRSRDASDCEMMMSGGANKICDQLLRHRDIWDVDISKLMPERAPPVPVRDDQAAFATPNKKTHASTDSLFGNSGKKRKNSPRGHKRNTSFGKKFASLVCKPGHASPPKQHISPRHDPSMNVLISSIRTFDIARDLSHVDNTTEEKNQGN